LTSISNASGARMAARAAAVREKVSAFRARRRVELFRLALHQHTRDSALRQSAA
jgi:hypothetical protein